VFRNSETATHDEWTTGAQVGMPEIPNLVEKTLSSIQKHLKSVIAPGSRKQSGVTGGLGQVSRRWAKSIFGNADELQASFSVVAGQDSDSQIDAPTTPLPRATARGGRPKTEGVLRLIEEPDKTKFEEAENGQYITNFHWTVSNNTRSEHQCSIAVESTFLTSDGREAVRKASTASTGDQEFIHNLAIIELRLKSEAGKFTKMLIDLPTSNIKCKDVVIPASGSTQVIARVLSPIGTAVYAEAKFA
jgi:hypothetical protein